jgi:oxygen-independent coproporphyrinogen-3 oxidase
MQLQPGNARVAQLLASRTLVDQQAGLEEKFFLGLRLNRGVSLQDIAARHGAERISGFDGVITELVKSGLLEHCAGRFRLTARGRLLSNEVFEKFLDDATAARYKREEKQL